jgi:hypothetical protein
MPYLESTGAEVTEVTPFRLMTMRGCVSENDCYRECLEAAEESLAEMGAGEYAEALASCQAQRWGEWVP